MTAKANIPFVGSVLHPTDFSPSSHRAFAHALALALLRQTDLTILHVGPESEDDVDWASFPQIRDTLQRWGLLEKDSPRAAVYEELGVYARKLSLKSENPVRAIRRYLNAEPHDVVVMATEGLAGAKFLSQGSDAEAIARGIDAMTLFVPADSKTGLVALADGDLNVHRILVPVVEDPAPVSAIEFARRAAEILGEGDAVITLLHVGDEMPTLPELPQGERWTWKTQLVSGDPVTQILGAAETASVDLIVMATNGRDTLGQVLKGSHTERIVRQAKCPVLAVPERRFVKQ